MEMVEQSGREGYLSFLEVESTKVRALCRKETKHKMSSR
jgi:hypothetical protein